MNKEKVVLLVDDEQSLLRATSIGLKDRGFTVYTAESGELAIQAIQSLKPGIVVSDLAMFLLGINYPPAYRKQMPKVQRKQYPEYS